MFDADGGCGQSWTNSPVLTAKKGREFQWDNMFVDVAVSTHEFKLYISVEVSVIPLKFTPPATTISLPADPESINPQVCPLLEFKEGGLMRNRIFQIGTIYT